MALLFSRSAHVLCLLILAVQLKMTRNIGALQYIVITRPETAFSVNRVCQFMQKPLDQHFKAVKHILRYLQTTMDYGISFKAVYRLSLVVYSEVNWGTNLDDKRSTTGFCAFLGGNPVSWGSREQEVVSHSTTEAEYRSLAHATIEVIWLEPLMSAL
ncbi:secreted RxLR effector protein 161-like [Gossypium raimondii]|uniref:secreted RxLR effector protein 161-like n=1 Tax=Gossypium raimondii TaxID=29730 RepID=UPI00227D2948|nr:secreted RxLR effector protein 161-like [Gossypium raimondii]